MLWRPRALIVLLGILLLQQAYGVYMDRINKSDWFQSNIGKVVAAESHKTSPFYSFVLSEQGVLAKINLKGGYKEIGKFYMTRMTHSQSGKLY